MALSKRLIELRRKSKLSQKDLATKLFVTDKTVSSWENGRTEPDIEMILKLSEIFNCNVSYLIGDYEKRNDIETEIKIILTEKEYRDLKTLLKVKAQFAKQIIQSDTYYKSPALEKNAYLRIGERGNKNILTYKHKHDNYCDEWEVEVDNPETLEKIFKALNITKLAMVEKVRNVFNYLDKYEIALDDVKNIGYFIEIEIKKYTLPKEEEYLKLIQVAKNLGLNLNNKANKHYLDYVLEKNKKLD